MSSVVSWVRRNRRKLAWSGAVVGGVYVLGRVVESQYHKYKEEENRKLINKVRKDNHYSATETTCVETLHSLFPLLRKVIAECLDTDSRTTELKQNKELRSEEKIRLWNELKIISVSRCLVLVVAGVYLALVLRVQLNILAGYLYQQEATNNNNIKMVIMTREIQEKFLSISNNFVNTGVKNLCGHVYDVVERCVDKIQLQQKLSLAELESLFQEVLKCMKSSPEDRNMFSNSGVYILPSTHDFINNLADSDQEILKKMFAEMLDVVECDDAVNTVNTLCRQGLSHVMDNVGEYFNRQTEKNIPDTTDKRSLQDSGFVSPASISLPLAKIIPVLASQVIFNDADGDIWLTHLLQNSSLKTLGANIYETFSFTSKDGDKDDKSWSDWLNSTVNSLF